MGKTAHSVTNENNTLCSQTIPGYDLEGGRKHVVKPVGYEYFFLYDNLLACRSRDSSKVGEIGASNWWFIVPGKAVVSTGRLLLNSCRFSASSQVSCLVYVDNWAEWCCCYAAQMFDAKTISRDVGKRYCASIKCAYRNCHSPLTILFHGQQLFRKIRMIFKRAIGHPNRFAFRYYTRGNHIKTRIGMLSCRWHDVDPYHVTLQLEQRVYMYLMKPALLQRRLTV